MTISTTNSRNDYTASSSQTTFAYTFPVTAESDILVYQDGTLKTISTHYSVSATPTGNVVFNSGLDSGVKVAIVRALPLTQSIDYVENDPFSAETHEDALDRLTIIAQQIDEEVGRTIKLAASSTTSNLTIPEPSADKYLAWNAAADALENKDIASLDALVLPVAVASGGTGLATLTDGGVLIGKGTADIEAMAVLANSEMIVGDGTTNPVAESGATLRTSIGVAIGSDVQAFDAQNALTDVAQTFTAAQRGTVTDIGSQASTVTVNLDTSNNHKVTLSGNAAFASPTGLDSDAIGQCGSIFITQDAGGTNAPTFHAAFDFVGGTAPTMTSTGDAVDRLDYIVVSATRLQCVVTLAYS